MDENINENMNVMKENDVLEQAKSNIDYAKNRSIRLWKNNRKMEQKSWQIQTILQINL